jgi:hypothetical protein
MPSMSNQTFVALLIGIAVLAYVAMAMVAYVRMRGTRIITCPETNAPAAVKVDAAHVAMHGMLEHGDIRLECCSRWPEREGCDQGCTRQIADEPMNTRVFNIVSRWAEDKSCAICRRSMPALTVSGPPLGLVSVASPTLMTVSWDEIPAEQIPAALASHLPVCPNCHLVESFRRDHAELVVDRHRDELRIPHR